VCRVPIHLATMAAAAAAAAASPLFSMFLRRLDGGTVPIDVGPNTTVAEIRDKVPGMELIFNGRRLPLHLTLRDLGIFSTSVFYAVPDRRAAGDVSSVCPVTCCPLSGAVKPTHA
jgi:hypothetical protein